MRLLLHICCAPDATYPIQILKGKYDLGTFFYNPNIHPEGEYQKRLKDARAVAEREGISFHEGRYEKDRWLSLARGYEGEPEGGKRCEICYRMRLDEAAKKAVSEGYDMFGAVLTISPRKDAEKINRIGRETGEKYGIPYLESNFKKKDGFKKSVEMGKAQGLYRQNYCGCEYSIKDGRAQKEKDLSIPK